MIKVLHIDTETGFRGGERQVQMLVEGSESRGVETVTVGPEDSKLLAALEQSGFATECYRSDRLGVYSPFLIQRIQKIAAKRRPQVVHAHTGKAHSFSVNAFLGKLPIVVTRRVDFPVKTNWFSRRKYQAKRVRFIAISTAIAEVLRAGGVSGSRITKVPSGVDLNRVSGGEGSALRAEWLGKDKGPLIGFVGALVDHKAPWILAEAAPLIRKELPGARVVLIGDGEERPRLERLAAANPNAIKIVGWRTDIADCYAALDLFVMPSKLEGLCTALIDALAVGVPAIASHAGGMPDVVIDGKTGLLVPPERPEALSDAVVRLWNSPELRERFVTEGRKHVENCFTQDAMVEGTLRVYNDLLNTIS